jgi:nitrite reductase (NADH) small subunit
MGTQPAASVEEWTPICPWSRLDRERGVAALVHGRQVAVFRTYDDRLYAIDNLDPKSGANVLSRGIVGTRGGVPTVASPMYKQAYDLVTGQCLDDPGVYVRTYPVRCREAVVEVGWRV